MLRSLRSKSSGNAEPGKKDHRESLPNHDSKQYDLLPRAFAKLSASGLRKPFRTKVGQLRSAASPSQVPNGVDAQLQTVLLFAHGRYGACLSAGSTGTATRRNRVPRWVNMWN